MAYKKVRDLRRNEYGHLEWEWVWRHVPDDKELLESELAPLAPDNSGPVPDSDEMVWTVWLDGTKIGKVPGMHTEQYTKAFATRVARSRGYTPHATQWKYEVQDSHLRSARRDMAMAGIRGKAAVLRIVWHAQDVSDEFLWGR